jgi:hypothetical protein
VRRRHSGAMPTGPALGRPDDRLRIEPGISMFPDVQLRIRGATHHPGMSVDSSQLLIRLVALASFKDFAAKPPLVALRQT